MSAEPARSGVDWWLLDLLTLLCQTAEPTFRDDDPPLPAVVSEFEGSPAVVANYWTGLYLLRASGLEPFSLCDAPPS